MNDESSKIFFYKMLVKESYKKEIDIRIATDLRCKYRA